MGDQPKYERCKNCFGTGTVFRQKILKIGGQRCPVCKGTCKVPVKPE